jgi:hypothetical protein
MTLGNSSFDQNKGSLLSAWPSAINRSLSLSLFFCQNLQRNLFFFQNLLHNLFFCTTSAVGLDSIIFVDAGAAASSVERALVRVSRGCAELAAGNSRIMTPFSIRTFLQPSLQLLCFCCLLFYFSSASQHDCTPATSSASNQTNFTYGIGKSCTRPQPVSLLIFGFWSGISG